MRCCLPSTFSDAQTNHAKTSKMAMIRTMIPANRPNLYIGRPIIGYYTSMDSHDACAKKIKGRALKLATIIVQ